MKRRVWGIPILAFMTLPSLGHAQSPADTAAIRVTALDYIEGWYTRDPVRIERALHPHVVKRYQQHFPNGQVRLTETSGLELVQQTRRGGGSAVPVGEGRIAVRILDIYRDVASVRVDAHQWIDYLHIVKHDGRWQIVNVLWEVRRTDAGGGAKP